MRGSKAKRSVPSTGPCSQDREQQHRALGMEQRQPPTALGQSRCSWGSARDPFLKDSHVLGTWALHQYEQAAGHPGPAPACSLSASQLCSSLPSSEHSPDTRSSAKEHMLLLSSPAAPGPHACDPEVWQALSAASLPASGAGRAAEPHAKCWGHVQGYAGQPDAGRRAT